MAVQKMNLIVLLLLSVKFSLEDSVYNSSFTKEIKLQKGRLPIKLKNKLLIFEFNLLVSTEPGHVECRLSPIDNYNSISILGNGKLLLIDDSVDRFNIIDFNNCSSYVSTLIPNDTRVHEDEDYAKFISAVTYNNTFDIFDHYQTICTPCRYNDKGERLQVEYQLVKEATGQDPEFAYQHDGYSLELVKDAFGVKNGYFYIFKYVNKTTALRILDSKFKVVKQRLFDAKIEAHSLTHENLTICYKLDACRNQYRGFCYYVKCHLLDSNLNTIAEVSLHQVSPDSSDNKIWVDMDVHNLIDGGAMVAMKFHFDRSQNVHRKDIFLQRIHPNGRIDLPIQFDSLDNDFVFMYHFTFNNGEYCLITVNDYYNVGSYTLIKCLNPSPADYDKF